MDDVARVVLALETPQVAEEVLHFLDRSGRARVVATAEDGRQLLDAVRQTEPDAVVAEPMLAIGGVPGIPLFALAARESVSALRAAVRAGARGFYVWPGEREPLLDGLASAAGATGTLMRRATVIAVHAARGGAGCTFVATHLAQAFERHGASCVLVDVDIIRGDLAWALGADDDARSLADLIPVHAEMTWEHLQEVLWREALLAPPAGSVRLIHAGPLRAAIETAASRADVVIAHLPRVFDEAAAWAVGQADHVLEVVNLDVAAFRGAARAREMEPLRDLEDRLGFVVNRAARSEITPADVKRVFGSEPLAVIGADPSVGRAQDQGRLLAPKGRIGRTFARLADRLWTPAEEEAA